jgi:peroxiredoxin
MRSLLLPALLCLTVPAMAADAPSQKSLSAFVLNDSAGHAYDTGIHIGKDVMVIAFWATWCKPCKIELAAVNKLYLKYKDKGLAFLAVSIDGPDSVAEVANYKRKYGYTFPVLLDTETAILERYNPRGDIPFSMVVDRNGAIVATHQGYNPGDEIALEAKLLKLLAATPKEQRKEGVSDPPVGRNQELATRVTGTESLQLRYLIDNHNGKDTDDGVFGIVNRLTIVGDAGPFNMGIRADNIAFPNYDRTEKCKSSNTGLVNCPWQDDHRIERMWLDYKSRRLELRVGDFYHSIGRGLVFSVRKIDELGVDTAVRGGRARGRIGPVTIQAFGGRSNISNTDLTEQGFVEDPEDPLAGGEITVNLPFDITLGARALWVDYNAYGSSGTEEGDWTAGGSLELRNLFDNMNVYLEGAFIKNLNTLTVLGKEINKDATGHALYGSVSLSPFEGMAILLEAKDYRRFLMTNPHTPVIVVYHEPPTMERFDQVVPNNENTTGARLLLEYYVKDWSTLFFANAVYYGYALSSDFDNDESVSTFDGKKGRSVMHGYGGVEKRWASGFFVNMSGGWRVEGVNKPAKGKPNYSRRLWHVETDIQVPLAGSHAVGVRTQHRTEDKIAFKDKHFHRGNVALTYSIAPAFSLGLLWSYQTEDDEYDAEGKPYRSHFKNLAAEIVYRFSGWGQFSIYGGRNTGDIICVSGVCRLLPPFYGVRSEFVARF